MLRNLAVRLADPRRGLLRQNALSTAAQTADAPLRLAADRRDLLDFFPDFVDDIREASRVVGIAEEAEWLAKAAEYNVPNGKLLRACATLNACRLLAPACGDRLSKTLAWSMDLLQAAYCVLDDLCDGDAVRRGRPSWHALVGVGAVNDAHLLEMSIYQVLRRRFRREPSYLHLLELFFDTTFRTGIGQNLDMHTERAGAKRFDDFDLERHVNIARYKTSFYSFYTPTAAAMHLDDFLDCFASVEKTGKAANNGDIRNGKCTWLVVEAKRRANDKQLARLKENYGSTDPQKVAAVLDLYEQLGVREASLACQREAFTSIAGRIDAQRSVPPAALHYVLNSIRYHVPQQQRQH